MEVEIKKSQKPVKYEDALRFMENRVFDIEQNKSPDLIWTLQHEEVYTAGKTYKENEIESVTNIPTVVEGFYKLPEGPGLGIDINYEFFNKYPYKTSWHRGDRVYPDNSIAYI